MIDIETVKAARALLNWQQDDLALAANISKTALNNFERGATAPHLSTLAAIRAALEEGGIEFMAGGGLRRASAICEIRQCKGEHFTNEMTEDIFAAVRRSGGEVLTLSTDESNWHRADTRRSNDAYIEWRARLAIREKTLIPEGHRVYNGPRLYYRELPAELIGKLTYLIYGDRIAFILWAQKQVTIMRNAVTVETFRQQFNFLWRMGKPVSGRD